MKRFGLVLALVLATVAVAQTLYGVSYIPSSQTAPTLGSDCSTSNLGLDISAASGWQVNAVPDAGDTWAGVKAVYSGNGTLQCFYCGTVGYPKVSGGTKAQVWLRCSTLFDLTPTASGAAMLSSQFVSSVGAGRVYYWPSIVGLTINDGGTRDGGFIVTIEAYRGLKP